MSAEPEPGWTRVALSSLDLLPHLAKMTLPFDGGPVSSEELQQAEKLLTAKNGAVTWHSSAEEPLPS